MAVDFETARYTARLLPQLGSKLASFRSNRSGFEYLWQPPSGQYPHPTYGQEYGPECATGFDECFPNLLAGRYPDGPYSDTVLPDHGEVWSLPWTCSAEGTGAVLTVHGRVLPYRLEKTVRPEGDASLLFAYRLTNVGEWPIRWLWSAHPLFNVVRGLHVDVPGRPAMMVYESLGDVLGAPGTRYTWPEAGSVDMSLPWRRAPAAEKVFLSELSEGRVALRYPSIGEGIVIEFPDDVLTGIGLWYNVGGWPEVAPHNNIGVEPCSEPCESLADCRNMLSPGATVSWWMRWTLFDWASSANIGA